MKQIVSVGIDVSKGKSTVCAMIHPNTIIKESFEVLHTVEEMSMLADYIGSLDGEIRIVMESTGIIIFRLHNFCIKKAFLYVLKMHILYDNFHALCCMAQKQIRLMQKN